AEPPPSVACPLIRPEASLYLYEPIHRAQREVKPERARCLHTLASSPCPPPRRARSGRRRAATSSCSRAAAPAAGSTTTRARPALRARDRRARRGAADDDEPGRHRARSREAAHRHARRGDLRRRVGGGRAAALPAGRGRPVSADLRRLRGRVAIVGVGESDEMGKLPHKSALALHAEAARNALADAGLAKADVDGVFSAGRWMSAETAEYLGIRPRFVDGTLIGGC